MHHGSPNALPGSGQLGAALGHMSVQIQQFLDLEKNISVSLAPTIQQWEINFNHTYILAIDKVDQNGIVRQVFGLSEIDCEMNPERNQERSQVRILTPKINSELDQKGSAKIMMKN